MHLEVICEDRIGMVRELLDLLASRNIDLRGIEIVPGGRVYLNFAALDSDDFRLLMTEIRRIDSVSDVRTVAFMPFEREQRALNTLVDAMPEPVFTLDMAGKPTLCNSATLALFEQSAEDIKTLTIDALIPGIDFAKRLEAQDVVFTRPVVIRGQDFLLEMMAIHLEDDVDNKIIAGALVILKSTARMSRQLQDHTVNDEYAFEQIVAVSPQMRQVVEQARKLAMLDAPLLIVGDTGTGKDMLARACHLRGPRGQHPFLALNCAALPDDVMESELFGHAPGAYPNAQEGKKGFFEQANGGSVLLDEVGEMSPQMQTKLLRFLNDGTFRRVGEDHEVHVDVRVICATKKNLLELVQRGEFREDLYYRLNVLTLILPPLSERPADIMPLAARFAARFAEEQGIARPTFSAEVAHFLPRYGWPGNVRQLRNAIYRALTQLEGNELRMQDIDLPTFSTDALRDETLLDGSLDDINKRFERSVLSRLYQSYPSTRKLAKRLGVSHTAIANKLREYGLSQRKAAGDDEQ
ncbi:transcriptional regulator TyrR [Pectobacterium cacticida]|uniref:HTH-type transcriptional regulatory protein TyrR n=1 Tax=Pectobacterium cacticida TaxID=69221 RepID=A0ABZ2G5R1_9GAMM|nr:transcriptional regulator TyrR [Pectobacterium cacticida]UYX08414.1 transcriptional regulator TyrR [Pectobacterium cacticida]